MNHQDTKITKDRLLFLTQSALWRYNLVGIYFTAQSSTDFRHESGYSESELIEVTHQMIEPEQDLKEKAKRPTKTSAIDFVLPVQLELCLHRIKIALGQDNLQINIDAYQNPLTPDEITATLFFRPHGDTQMRIDGTLQRWEGTSTRFEGNFTTSAWQPRILILLMIITVLYPIPAGLLSYVILAPISDTAMGRSICIYMQLIWALPYLVILRLLSRWSDRLTYRAFREAVEAHLRVKSEV